MSQSTRPAGTPPPPPPPSKRPAGPPSKPPNRRALVAPALLAEADAILGDTTPARRDPMGARSPDPSAVATTGGPVTFSLPPTPAVPQFVEGEHRLVGRVGELDEAEAEALARLMTATCECFGCTLPDGMPPFPGSPPGPPPTS